MMMMMMMMISGRSGSRQWILIVGSHRSPRFLCQNTDHYDHHFFNLSLDNIYIYNYNCHHLIIIIIQQSEPSGLVARPIVSSQEIVNFPDGPEVMVMTLMVMMKMMAIMVLVVLLMFR